MIKFFRKIRYNLMDTGKTRKYFKYAIGEIILVVIGILIALSINNWNEEQKKNSLKNEYIISLKNDYTRDTIQLNNRIHLNKEDLKKLALTKNKIINGEVKTIEDFKELYNNFYGLIRFTNTYNTNSFNLLISSGNIDLLNKQLREEIMELNRLQNFEQSLNSTNRDYFIEFMGNMSKYPFSANPYNPESLNELLWKGVQIDALPRDITSYLGQYEFTIGRYIELTTDVVSQTEKVLNMLQQ